MTRLILCAASALALMGGAAPARAALPATSAPPTADPAVVEAVRADPAALPAVYVRYFFDWKEAPADLKVAALKVMPVGGALRVLCGSYLVEGQAPRPFMVMGDDGPNPRAAWEPGSFPESDPAYPQLMQNLRSCQTSGVDVQLRPDRKIRS